MFSIQELRSSTKKELLQELERARKEALKVRINVKTKHDKDGSKAGKTKHYVAQILTVLKEAESEEAEKAKETEKEKSKIAIRPRAHGREENRTSNKH